MCQALSPEGWRQIVMCAIHGMDSHCPPRTLGHALAKERCSQAVRAAEHSLVLPPSSCKNDQMCYKHSRFMECEVITSNVKLCSWAFPELFFFFAMVDGHRGCQIPDGVKPG